MISSANTETIILESIIENSILWNENCQRKSGRLSGLFTYNRYSTIDSCFQFSWQEKLFKNHFVECITKLLFNNITSWKITKITRIKITFLVLIFSDSRISSSIDSSSVLIFKWTFETTIMVNEIAPGH